MQKKIIVISILFSLLFFAMQGIIYAQNYLSLFRMGMSHAQTKRIIERRKTVAIDYNPPLKDIVSYIIPREERANHPYYEYPEAITVPYLYDQTEWMGISCNVSHIFTPRTKLLALMRMEWPLYDVGFGHRVRNWLSLQLMREPTEVGKKYQYVWFLEGVNRYYNRISVEYGKDEYVVVCFYGNKYYDMLIEEIEAMKAEYDAVNGTEDVEENLDLTQSQDTYR